MAPRAAVEDEDESTNQATPSQELSLRSRRGVAVPPLRPTTPVDQVHGQADGQCDLPVTPTAQLMLEPATPMAPARNVRKRTLHQGQPESHLGRDASPSPPGRIVRSVEDSTSTTTAVTSAATAVTSAATAVTSAATAVTAARRPQSMLKNQGLAVFASSFKQNPHKSQALVDMIERDSSLMDRLKCLIDRGRRFGGSPTYSFNQGRTRIRYVYLSAKDVEYAPVADSPRKKRESGSLWSSKQGGV
ncbi:hypothetical protein DV737_g4227, partial [Chaetothyriales sp. CBS 132003]